MATHHMAYPSYGIFVDQVGSNNNQKGDVVTLEAS